MFRKTCRNQNNLNIDVAIVIMDRETPYQYQLHDIHYNNDSGYRSCMRKLFCMITHEDLDSDLDIITKDENNYDEESAQKAMDFIYEKTHNHPLFQILYEKAAACMFSSDHGIGLAVLFSYDYMASFHKCIQRFFTNPDNFNEECDEYKEIHTKLT